jgi:hypothetical protein
VTNVYRVVAGFKGDFDVLGRNWKWDANFNYGSTAESERYYQINEANFLNAIDVVKNPATGQIECAVTANPPPLPSTGIQPTSVTGCQPLDLFGQGAPSAAAANFVTAQDLALAGLTERDAQINLTGSPFDDWAGKVEFATGFEFRQESGSYNVDAFANSGLGRNPPVSDVAGGYNTKEFYAESTIPVISAKNNIPFVTDLEFNGAYRYIDNSYAGGANVYTLGGRRPSKNSSCRPRAPTRSRTILAIQTLLRVARRRPTGRPTAPRLLRRCPERLLWRSSNPTW